LCVVLLLGHSAGTDVDFVAAEASFSETPPAIEPFEDDLYQVEGNPEAQAFASVNFGGKARNEDTPVVVNGHSNIRSLRVPAGQCASLFDQPGYNEYADGQMLQVHGPMDVPDLATIALLENKGSWLEKTASYKMGKCTATTASELATNIVRLSARNTKDLSQLSHAATQAVNNGLGSVIVSRTKQDPEDIGVAYPYDQHHGIKGAVEVMQTGVKEGGIVETTEYDADRDEHLIKMKPKDFSQTEVSQEIDKIEGERDYSKDMAHHDRAAAAVKELVNSGHKLHNYTAAELAAHHAAGVYSSERVVPVYIPFPVVHDDPEDLKDIENAGKNSAGCDPTTGCYEPPVCVDQNSTKVCKEVVDKGECDFQKSIDMCRKTCGYCKKAHRLTGSTSMDVTTDSQGHYYLGQGRRRVGAGFGRRRAPVKEMDPVTKKKKELEKRACVQQGTCKIHVVEETVAKTVTNPSGKVVKVGLVRLKPRGKEIPTVNLEKNGAHYFKKYAGKYPHCKNFECFTGGKGWTYAEASAKCAALHSCTGFSFSSTSKAGQSDNPKRHGKGCIKECGEVEFGGYVKGKEDYWAKTAKTETAQYHQKTAEAHTHVWTNTTVNKTGSYNTKQYRTHVKMTKAAAEAAALPSADEIRNDKAMNWAELTVAKAKKAIEEQQSENAKVNKPLSDMGLGCYDTRPRGELQWVAKGRTKDTEEAKTKCKGYEYMSLECPNPGGFEIFCVNKPSTHKLPDKDCQGTPTDKTVTDGDNRHCVGPYKYGNMWVGGAHRGVLYPLKA